MKVDRARLQAEITDITRRYAEAGYFPSASVLAFDAHEFLAAACVGEAREDSLFDLASLTKIATAVQVLNLIRAGRISLESTLSDVLPGISADPFLNARAGEIPFRRLLTHTSSLPAWYPFYTTGEADFFAALRIALTHTEPSEGVEYSDLNFMLLGKVLETLQGKPLARCLREDLAEPLGLGQICYHPDAGLPVVPSCYGNPIEMDMCAQRGLSYSGFRPVDQPVAGTVNDGNAHYYFHDEAGHAGVFADAAALARLCQFFMNTDDPLLLAAQEEQPGAPGRGLGFQTGISYPHGCGHTGFTGTGIYFSRTHGVGVISLTNRLFYPYENPMQTWEFRRALQEAVFALAAQP